MYCDIEQSLQKDTKVFRPHSLSTLKYTNLSCSRSHVNNNMIVKLQVVHFVRDPIDMIISSYLYHSQDVSPEGWTNPHFPCHYYIRHNLEVVSKRLEIKWKELFNVVKLCRKLNDNSRKRDLELILNWSWIELTQWLLLNIDGCNRNYHSRLMNLDSESALRLEAFLNPESLTLNHAYIRW